MELAREFRAEAAHWLPCVPVGHKCRRLHGHSYRITVYVEGPVGEDGMVCDFADIDEAVQPIIDEYLDHRLLNDTIDNPTSENVARWLWGQIEPRLPGLAGVTVAETCRSAATVRAQR